MTFLKSFLNEQALLCRLKITWQVTCHVCRLWRTRALGMIFVRLSTMADSTEVSEQVFKLEGVIYYVDPQSFWSVGFLGGKKRVRIPINSTHSSPEALKRRMIIRLGVHVPRFCPTCWLSGDYEPGFGEFSFPSFEIYATMALLAPILSLFVRYWRSVL